MDCCILQQLPITGDTVAVAAAGAVELVAAAADPLLVAELAWLLAEFMESEEVSEDPGLFKLVSLILGTKAFWLLLKMLALT